MGVIAGVILRKHSLEVDLNILETLGKVFDPAFELCLRLGTQGLGRWLNLAHILGLSGTGGTNVFG